MIGDTWYSFCQYERSYKTVIAESFEYPKIPIAWFFQGWQGHTPSPFVSSSSFSEPDVYLLQFRRKNEASGTHLNMDCIIVSGNQHNYATSSESFLNHNLGPSSSMQSTVNHCKCFKVFSIYATFKAKWYRRKCAQARACVYLDIQVQYCVNTTRGNTSSSN